MVAVSGNRKGKNMVSGLQIIADLEIEEMKKDLKDLWPTRRDPFVRDEIKLLVGAIQYWQDCPICAVKNMLEA